MGRDRPDHRCRIDLGAMQPVHDGRDARPQGIGPHPAALQLAEPKGAVGDGMHMHRRLGPTQRPRRLVDDLLHGRVAAPRR